VLLKSLVDATDAQIYNRLVKGYFRNRQIGDRVEVLLQEGSKLSVFTQDQCLAYIGSILRAALVGLS